MNAQGGVVGIRTPKKIALLAKDTRFFAELEEVRGRLTDRDMQDFEFTIEDGRLFTLQTRNGKRTGLAAVRIAVEMNQERLMTRKTALLKIPAESIDSLLVPVFDAKAMPEASLIGRGSLLAQGRHLGRSYFLLLRQSVKARLGKKVILVREETSQTTFEACCWRKVF